MAQNSQIQMADASKMLSEERLGAIWKTLIQTGHAQAAKELSDYIAVLNDEVTLLSQYYQEFLIPGMEGRKVGAWSDSVVMKPRRGEAHIQEKSGRKISLP